MYRKAGFTLIEILLAMFIFTIVAMIITSALHTVITTQTATEKSAARLNELQMALIFLSRDFEQTIERPITNANNAPEEAFIGSEKTAIFTHAGVTNPLGNTTRSTLQRTRYRLDNKNLVRDTWFMLDLADHTPPNQRTLLKGITDLKLEYLDAAGKFQPTWPPPADSAITAKLPKAVRVSLTLVDFGEIIQLYIIPGQMSEQPK